MTSPRKFAEKIALHNQKQAEGTAEFEQVMRDVHKATKADARKSVGICQTDALQTNYDPLPSVANVGVQASCTVVTKIPGQPGSGPSPCISPALSPDEGAPGGGGGGGGGGRGRSAGVGPMRSRPVDKQRVDTSPYGTPMPSSPYLTPPSDSTWRRTHSDSALHQSSTAEHLLLSPMGAGPLSPATARRVDTHNQLGGGSMHVIDQRTRRHLSASPDGRGRSCTTSQPRAISNNMYQLQQDMQQMPTGSLPDLTNLHFPPPLHTPLDQDDSNSMYGTSPRTSTAMLSPNTPINNVDRFTYSPHTSRGPSPEPGAGQSPLSPHSIHSSSPLSPIGPHSPNSLTVPEHYRYLHACKGVTYDNGSDQSQTRQDNQQNQPSQFLYQCSEDPHLIPHMNASSPININSNNMHSAHDINSLGSYRNPQSISRPSPQSSPAQHYRCSSPHSAPPSPVGSSPSYMPENTFYSQAQALQQGLESFSMSDEPLSQVHEPPPDLGYFSTSPAQLHYSQSQNHGHMNNICDSRTTQQPQTPNTPTSIPDIILTEADDLAKELGSAIVGSLDLEDVEDVFPSDALRESLSRLDAEALDLLTNPSMVTDPATEARFRMENDSM